MKFIFKYTERIVGTFVIAAIAIVAIVAGLIAINNKVFEKKYVFKTRFSDAIGLTSTTPISFKGYQIGRITDYQLNDQNFIDAEFEIYEEYRNRITSNAVLNKSKSLLGGATTIELIQGAEKGEPIDERGVVPSLDTPEGKTFARKNQIKLSGDALASMMSNLDNLLYKLNQDNNPDDGAIFRTLVNLADATEELKHVLSSTDKTLSEIRGIKSSKQSSLARVVSNVGKLTDNLDQTVLQLTQTLSRTDSVLQAYQNPNGLVMRMLDPEGKDFAEPLSRSLTDLSESLRRLNGLLEFVDSQSPDIMVLIDETREALKHTRRTMQGLSNNPFLRGGISKEPDNIEPNGEKIRIKLNGSTYN